MGLIKITGGGVIERIGGICDGQTIKSTNGDITLENVTANQNLTTSYVDQTGSSITYTAPTGTKTVIYEAFFQISVVDSHSISHHRLYIDTDEVTDARTTYGSTNNQATFHFKYAIPIGGTADVGTSGRLASWTDAKTLKLQVREYGSSNEQFLHNTQHWDGSGTNVFRRPLLFITALS